MKKPVLVFVCLMTAIFAHAQIVPYYAEVYNERTGKLEYKEWVAANGNFRQETVSGDVTIFHLNTNTAYSLDINNKTYRTVPMSLIGKRTAGSGGNKSEYIGDELVEGKMCKHYFYSDGRGTWHEWIYPPLNTWICYMNGLYETSGDDKSIKRNIVTGSQPASLFEIPRGFTTGSAPAADALGGMLNTLNDPNKTQAEKMQEMMKMLGQ